MRRAAVLLLAAFVVAVTPSAVLAHPEPGDIDGDGVGDQVDNCAQTKNGEQNDTDRDGLGDVCDTDADDDGVDNAVPRIGGPDNCPLAANSTQADTDGDGWGDVCDIDTDLDGRQDPIDNCPLQANPDQADYDFDRTGDLCDPDDDDDGEFDVADNCPRTYNYDQVDADGDGVGAACDADDRPAPGGLPSPPPPPPDVAAPTVRLSVAKTLRLRELGSSIAVQVRCSESCSVRAQLTASKRKLASGTAALGGSGTTYVFLRKLRRLTPATATLKLTATDAAGNASRLTRRLKLRR